MYSTLRQSSVETYTFGAPLSPWVTNITSVYAGNSS